MYFILDALPEIQILEVIYPVQTMWFDRPMCKFFLVGYCFFFRNILLTVHKTLIPIGLELGEEVGKFPISISHKTLSHD